MTLIDRRNYHLFQPLLYQVATGSLSPGQIAAPLRSVLSRQKNTRVLMGDVVDTDRVAKRVVLADGAAFEYDSLIVAAGSQTSYYGRDVWRGWAPGMKSVEEATSIRHKILYAFEVAERLTDPVERRAWLRFVIVGAGATGVELAGAIGEIARQTLKNDFRSIRPQEADIILLDGAPRVLMAFPEDLARKAAGSLAKLGVRVKTGVMVKDIDRDGVTIDSHIGTDRLTSRTVIWAGGVTASVTSALRVAGPPAFENGRLCSGDGGHDGGGDRPRRALVLPSLRDLCGEVEIRRLPSSCGFLLKSTVPVSPRGVSRPLNWQETQGPRRRTRSPPQRDPEANRKPNSRGGRRGIEPWSRLHGAEQSRDPKHRLSRLKQRWALPLLSG